MSFRGSPTSASGATTLKSGFVADASGLPPDGVLRSTVFASAGGFTVTSLGETEPYATSVAASSSTGLELPCA